MHFLIENTPAQFAIGLCFVVFAPALAVASAFVDWRRGGRGLPAALVTLVASWTGSVVGCVAALALFPGYPADDTSEWIAMLFALPGPAMGALVVQRVRAGRAVIRERDGKALAWRSDVVAKKGASLLVAATVLASSLLVFAHLWLSTPPAAHALPWSAEVIFQRRDSYDRDYFYRIDVRMSREQYVAWVEELGFVPTGDEDDLTYEEPGSDERNSGCVAHFVDGIATLRSWSI